MEIFWMVEAVHLLITILLAVMVVFRPPCDCHQAKSTTRS